ARAGVLDDAASELSNRDLLGGADVEYVAGRTRLREEPRERSDDICDVAEAAHLAPVAVDRKRLARERLADEARHDHSVAPSLARAHGVEQAHDRDRQAALPPVGHRQELVDRLR